MPDKKYSIILADPPWSFKTYSPKGDGRSANQHYKVMTKQEIAELGGSIINMAADDCVLFLWVTFPCLEEGLQLCRAWGFEYKTVGFVWVKKNKKADSLFWGMGYWTRANAEVCLIATRGNPKRLNKGVHQVLIEKIGEHSEKPVEVRERIVKLMGDLPRIELFCRGKGGPGWSVWGNEAENPIDLV